MCILMLLESDSDLPASKFPSSAACPLAKIVLTKIPIFPLGESRPPTMLKPSDFIPTPLLYRIFR